MGLGVLTQTWEPHQQSIAYLRRELDVISRGWPHLLRVIVAMALLTPEALKIINGWNLTVLTTHDMSWILNSKINTWMINSRILKYQSLLLEGSITKLKVCRKFKSYHLTSWEGKWNTWSRLFPISNFKLCSSGKSNGHPIRQSWHGNIYRWQFFCLGWKA